MARLPGTLWFVGSAVATAVFWIMFLFGFPLVLLVFVLVPVPVLLSWYRVYDRIPSPHDLSESRHLRTGSVLVMVGIALNVFFGPLVFLLSGSTAGLIFAAPRVYRAIRPSRVDSSEEPSVSPNPEPPV